MKRCPRCNRVENDDSLAFCRIDGEVLTIVDGSDPNAATVTLLVANEPETSILPSTKSNAEFLKPTVPTTVIAPSKITANTRSLRKPKWRKVVLVMAPLIVIAVVTCVYLFWLRNTKIAPIESIAVMPFVNETGNADVDYLSDGMTETLISSLSQLPNLNVKARSSVFRYKGKATDAKTIGKELNVHAILNGRVVQRGDQLKLSLELVDVQTENVIWSGQYDRKQADLVTLHNEIAHDVSNKLRVKLSGADEQKLAKSYTVSAEAYQLYLRGLFHWNKRTPRDLQKSVEYFEQATAIDSNYALAFAGLADAYALLSAFGGAQPREVMPKAKEAALKALSLDNQLAEAHVALGYTAQFYDYDFVTAEREFKRGIELNPRYVIAHEFYGTLLSNLNRHEEADAQFRLALQLEPLSLGANRMYGETLFFARKYDESIAQLKKTIELDESFASAHRSLSRVYLMTRNYPGHVEEYSRYFELIGDPQAAMFLRESFTKVGWQGFMTMMTGDKRPTRYYAPFTAASYFALLGEKDKATAELNKTFDDRLYYCAWMRSDPPLDPLRDYPPFQELLKKVGPPR